MLILLAVMIKFFDSFAWKSKNVPTRYLILNVGAFAESLIPIKKTSGKNKSSVVEDQHRIEKNDLLHSIQVLSGLANTVS
jgi:hypothetical protein